MDKDGLSYKGVKKANGVSKTEFAVYLGNRRIGTIRKVKLGYQYFPKGSDNGGDVYVSIEQVKRSLELPSEEE